MMAATNGWLRVGSKGDAFGVKNISSTTARMANNMIEQLCQNAESVSVGHILRSSNPARARARVRDAARAE